MNPRPGITFLIISLLSTAATRGGDGAPSAKDALTPSAKDALTPSAKDASPLSPKSSKDIIPAISRPPQGDWNLGAGISWRDIGVINSQIETFAPRVA